MIAFIRLITSCIIFRDIVQECSIVQECPPDWWVGNWQSCINGSRRRSVLCVLMTTSGTDSNRREIVLPDNICNDYSRPLSFDPLCALGKSRTNKTNIEAFEQVDGNI